MRLVILDRDGVINEDSDAFIKSPDEWRPLPGSLEAIARLTHAHVHVVVVTNQSGIARGLLDLDMLQKIHTRMHRELALHGGRIDAIYYCPHGPDDNCHCRKPKAGMLRDLGKRLRIDLTGVPAIGDSLRDLQAAQAVNARPILVRTGKGRRTEQADGDRLGCEIYDDLATAVDRLLEEVV
jgi:D-glycero-D-manno-heptose 1,7-bisphosphate phosphatase